LLARFLDLYTKLVNWVAMPVFVGFFLRHKFATDHKLGLGGKLELIRRFRSNHRRIRSASHWLQHLHMAAEILNLPADLPGVVVECGCFKGGSTANLSLACKLAGRDLVVCDSFEGLPEPVEHDRFHEMPFVDRVKRYEKGQYQGQLEEVKENIRRYGCLEVCQFVEGYFKDTLPRQHQPVAFAFVDVDLHDSLIDCLQSIWPRLQPGCRLYSHEAQDLGYIARFFDDGWWRQHLGTGAPGFIGAGTGLPVQGIARGSAIGYTVKSAEET